MVLDPTAHDAESVRLAALAALRRWALRRDRIAEERGDLLASAWQTGNRNVRELAALADVSRTTVYTDLQARSIDPRVRSGPVRAPRAAPLDHDDVRELAGTMMYTLMPAMLQSEPDPLASAAWQLHLAMVRIADTLAATTSSQRAETLGDLAYRGQQVSRAAHQVLADQLTGQDLALLEIDDGVAAMDLGELHIDRAQVQIGLPNGEVVRVALNPGDTNPNALTGWTWTSDRDLLTPPTGPDDHIAARLDIAAALDTIAAALRPSAAPHTLTDPEP